MRRFGDEECDENENVEMAKIAAVTCMHQCIEKCCGGDKVTGKGCRFDFPKKLLNHSVPAVMQLNSDQMETRLLLRRTCDRISNLNTHLLKYLRSNHDVTVLIDASHSQRYCTKYVSKSSQSDNLLSEVVDYLRKRYTDLLPPNMKQVLSHLVLADCSHKSFISRQELAFKVMNLPEVSKSYSNVKVVGFYKRANISQNAVDEDLIVYSDRTQYSAYAERCLQSTVLEATSREVNPLTQHQLLNMNFREFADTVTYRWVADEQVDGDVPISGKPTKKFRTRDAKSGHWAMRRCTVRHHVRWSTVLYTPSACEYEPVVHDKSTTQMLYFELPIEKRKQLYRAYQELICYVPWQNSPEKFFLSEHVQLQLKDELQDPEREQRYSLRRLEEFFYIYKTMWKEGRVAPENSDWHRDNQYS